MPDAEDQPAFSQDEAVGQAPRVLRRDVYPEALDKIDSLAREREGVSIYELSETKPRYAYVYLAHLFKHRFIDTANEDWGIGSPEEDGQMAYDGLVRYMKRNTAPDPDIDEIEVVVAVCRRNSWFNRLRGKTYSSEEALRFRVGPQDLAFS